MKIYPAIDLIAGGCVRLSQGRFDRKTSYAADPVEVAKGYAAQGARYLHVVDLEGSRSGEGRQTDTIFRIVRESGLKAQVGGGVRSPEAAERYLAAGIDRVIFGSLAVKDEDAVKQALRSFGPERVTLAVDVRIQEGGTPLVAVSGWEEPAALSAWELIERFRDAGLNHVLCTDIERDGTGRGPNVPLYLEMARRYPELEVQASGGVGSLDDLRELKRSAIPSVIIGKALLDGRFTLEEALRC
ncbi:MAG: 1-(5-phosphoribosyl)-5-[(5-phosphoribosylamino)methylideneamino]imidazole-4-carboxamide isomerase [Elusimicrobiota bacterium]